jgi:hypothetical protein
VQCKFVVEYSDLSTRKKFWLCFSKLNRPSVDRPFPLSLSF